jgi:hypothetical protein
MANFYADGVETGRINGAGGTVLWVLRAMWGVFSFAA